MVASLIATSEIKGDRSLRIWQARMRTVRWSLLCHVTGRTSFFNDIRHGISGDSKLNFSLCLIYIFSRKTSLPWLTQTSLDIEKSIRVDRALHIQSYCQNFRECRWKFFAGTTRPAWRGLDSTSTRQIIRYLWISLFRIYRSNHIRDYDHSPYLD